MYLFDLRVRVDGSGTEESLEKFKGICIGFPAKHALTAEVRYYDRLFTDETPDLHKDKDFFGIYKRDSLTQIFRFVEPSLPMPRLGIDSNFNRDGIFQILIGKVNPIKMVFPIGPSD